MNRMTVYDQTRLCFKVIPHQEQGRSVIQELGIYEDIHEEEIKKARNITDIRDLYFTKGAKLDPYWENLGKPKTERSGWISVTKKLAPEEATNGDMIQAMFPYGEYGTNGNEVHVFGVGGNGCLVFTLDWWNAPYNADREV